jgi:hypothetical protein
MDYGTQARASGNGTGDAAGRRREVPDGTSRRITPEELRQVVLDLIQEEQDLPTGKERMPTNGTIVEGTVVDSTKEGTKQHPPEEPGDRLGALADLAGALRDKRQGLSSRVRQAIEKHRKLREDEAKWGNPGGSNLSVRRSGILHREHPADHARAEALKGNQDLAYLLFDYLVLLAKLEASGKKVGMELFDYLTRLDGEYPAELAPFGELFTEKGIDTYLEAYDQAIELLGDRGLADIMRAMLVGSARQVKANLNANWQIV